MDKKIVINLETNEILEEELTQLELEIRDADRLVQSKQNKVIKLSEQCRNSIVNGFTATNGHQYRLELEDQLNMQGQKSELDDDPSITTVPWRTIDVGYINHTREEWLTVYAEAFQHKKTQLFKLDNLRTQALNATTQSELDAIVW
jgi:hypothetical protein